jgi:outer membrane protein assembly factor BamA
VEGTWSAIWREYDVEFTNPYLFRTRTAFQNTASWRKEYRKGYDYERTRGQTSLGRELVKHLNGTAGVRLDRNVVYNLDPNIAATTPDLLDARAMFLGLNWDNANDFFFPTRGARIRSSFERYGGGLGGDLDMHRAEVESYHYHPLWGPFTAAVALRGGWSDTFGKTQDVPVFERFFMGGGNTVRGYKERDVGPRSPIDDNPLGGRKMAGATVETRFPLFWRFRGALFVDGGQVAEEWFHVRPAVWKYSAGAGIRFVTPVGPFRLDGGYKLNRDKGDLETYRIHFSLGESF